MSDHETELRVRPTMRAGLPNGWKVEQWAQGVGWFRVAWFMVESDAEKWARDH